MKRGLLWIVMLVSVLCGCATPQPSERQDRTEPKSAESGATGDDETPEQAKPSLQKPAVIELTKKAEAASADGDHARAVRLLERALRLSPRNAGLWQNLAVVRYRQGGYTKAESLAQRSNRLSGDAVKLRQRNWSLIEAARRKLGDAAGARKARQRASGLADEVAAP